MPIVVNGGVISYTTPQHQRLAEQTFSFADVDWSIHDKDNVLKQIKFEIVPLTDAPGTLTIQCDIAGDQTITLSSIINVNSFSIMQPDSGTSPTATSPTDTLILTAGNNLIDISGDSGTNTITFTPNIANISSLFDSTIQDISSTTTIVAQFADLNVHVHTSGGAFTITLPSASSVRAGWRISLKDKDGTFRANNLTIAPAGADTIETINAVKVVRGNFQSITLQSDASTAWCMD